MNYYNEFDPFAAAWLQELIKAGLIPQGEVDTRSICDVTAGDLRGYTQCHFFAGIGGWSRALQLAGWPADRPVWTGSCPCQPFSSAGKGAGFDDERHLWPVWERLIRECRPPVVFGEQVASKATGEWFDLVQLDLEAMDYAFGLVPFPAAGIGAPHIRDRAYWVGHSIGQGLEGYAGDVNGARGWAQPAGPVAETGGAVRVEHTQGNGREQRGAEHVGRGITGGCGQGGLADTEHAQRGKVNVNGQDGCDRQDDRREEAHGEPGTRSEVLGRTSPTNGFWADADWLLCRDGKWRPVEPGTFPLAHGVSSRVGKLRGYGNAIVPPQAAEFIGAFMEAV